MIGVHVLDISNIIAGPLASCLLADFGADVVKVEMPRTGDALRLAPPHKSGVPLWWKVTNRNKRCITIDLHKAEGQELIRRLVPYFDVLIENFRPGVLERWGLGWETLHCLNQKLTMLRVTGYGQSGPYAGRAGFARMAEAFAGLAYITGTCDTPPLHAGYPIADALTGVFGAMAVGFALWERDRNGGMGQCIDLSLYETVLRTIEYLIIEYDQLRAVRERGGNLSQYVAPSNIYKTSDDHWVSITTSTPTIYRRFVQAIGRPDLLDDPDASTPEARLNHRARLDQVVADWVGARTLVDVDAALGPADVAYAAVNSVRELFADPHVAARENIITVPDPELGVVRMQGVTPKFSRTPGRVRWAGPSLGSHTEETLRSFLSLSDDEIENLRAKDVI
jgi:crotonobetainyl-CoA:carnitine CoA-transferase CaiB-like acyl-CoA transferase